MRVLSSTEMAWIAGGWDSVGCEFPDPSDGGDPGYWDFPEPSDGGDFGGDPLQLGGSRTRHRLATGAYGFSAEWWPDMAAADPAAAGPLAYRKLQSLDELGSELYQALGAKNNLGFYFSEMPSKPRQLAAFVAADLNILKSRLYDSCEVTLFSGSDCSPR